MLKPGLDMTWGVWRLGTCRHQLPRIRYLMYNYNITLLYKRLSTVSLDAWIVSILLFEEAIILLGG